MDLTAAGTLAVARREALAPLLVFGAGLLSSVGPCVAPRFIAIAALAAQARRPFPVVAAFVGGLVAAYAAFGVVAAALASLVEFSTSVYGLVAAALLGGGLWTLLRAGGGGHGHAHGPSLAAGAAGLLRSALLGAGFAFVVSPCCTPLMIGIVTLCANPGAGGAPYAALLLACFALGHCAPLALTGAAGGRAAATLGRLRLAQPAAIVNGSLMLALGAYYAVLV